MPVAVEMDTVTKIYRRGNGRPPVHAVTCLCLSAPAGQILGLLGQENAGKTTVLNLIGGLIKPTAGHVLVNGYDTKRDPREARRQIKTLLAPIPGSDRRSIPAQPIVLIDEPAPGIDVLRSQQTIRELAQEHGKTVVLATRAVRVARTLCNHVAILHRGRLIADMEARFLEERYLALHFCQIKVKGQLTDTWTGWFSNLTMTPYDNGEMMLSGPIVDQAALYGLLIKVRDLGLPLLSVRYDPRTLGERVRGHCHR